MIQDTFLNHVRVNQISVSIFLMNGFPMKGKIKGFDRFGINIESDGKQQYIYKHAISTIVPAEPVPIFELPRVACRVFSATTNLTIIKESSTRTLAKKNSTKK
jgi:host factor-I protein